MKAIATLAIVFLCFFNVQAQVTTGLPEKIDPTGKYMFYLHGAIVQSQGENAVSPTYGKYMYRDIVNKLASHGYNVISEVRPKDATVDGYATIVAKQVKTLLEKGVPAKNIVVVGASMGASITTQAAIQLHNKHLKFVVMGMCHEGGDDSDADKVCGNFLSIYESSDGAGSCVAYLKGRKCVSNFKEVVLKMGNAHGFLYQPYKEWVDPVVEFAK